MPWPCVIVEQRKVGDTYTDLFVHDGKIVQFADLPVGAMYLDEGDPDDLIVKLPSGAEWLVDRGRVIKATHPQTKIPAWTRTGTLPNITVTPSINHQGHYHGYLTAGVLTSDCEGRKFAGEPKG